MHAEKRMSRQQLSELVVVLQGQCDAAVAAERYAHAGVLAAQIEATKADLRALPLPSPMDPKQVRKCCARDVRHSC